MEGKVIDMGFKEETQEQKPQPQKISYDELEKVAQQAYQEANMWKQKAYEVASKTNRVELILSILELEQKFKTSNNDSPFQGAFIVNLCEELQKALYPPVDTSTGSVANESKSTE